MDNCKHTRNRIRQDATGFALTAVLLLSALIGALIAGYSMLTRLNLKSSASSKDQVGTYFAAEAAVNLRAIQLKQLFDAGQIPQGTSPENRCIDGAMGDGDFLCKTIELGQLHSGTSYIEEEPTNPTLTRIPIGEMFEGFQAEEYRFTVVGRGQNKLGQTGALLEMVVRNQLLPLFQFAIFYNKDLEISPKTALTIDGAVHSNNDIFLDSEDLLTMHGQISLVGNLIHGVKQEDNCTGAIEIVDPIEPIAAPECQSRRKVFTNQEVASWNGNVLTGINPVTPPAESLSSAFSNSVYWQNADLRIVLRLDNNGSPDTTVSSTGITVVDSNGSINTSGTTDLLSCRGSLFETSTGANDGSVVATHANFYNLREAKFIRLLEVDLQSTLDCLSRNLNIIGGRNLDDESDGGLVFHLSVLGPDSDQINSYGVRIRNAAELQSSRPPAKTLRGLTLVSDQALYTLGDFNTIDKIPASIVADTYNVLSDNWDDANSQDSNKWNRIATSTSINAAILAGTDTTGFSEGETGRDTGAFSGGIQDFTRLYEAWRTCDSCERIKLSITGSLVSHITPKHYEGRYDETRIETPDWQFSFDSDLLNRSSLPPLTPNVVQLRQETFTRLFE